jgi:DNA-binding MarR family transcriptional regulator
VTYIGSTLDIRGELRTLMHRARDLTPMERNMVMLYALAENKSGYVDERAQDLAVELGVAATVFSRVRKSLVVKGWLQQARSEANIRYYCLSDYAYGRQSVRLLRA